MDAMDDVVVERHGPRRADESRRNTVEKWIPQTNMRLGHDPPRGRFGFGKRRSA